MSMPSARSSRRPRASHLSAWIAVILTGLTAAAACKKDPTSPGEPIAPPSGGIGSTSTGGMDGTGNVLTTGGSGGGSVITGNADAKIDLWYGDDQTFGSPGAPAPQRWINLLGRAEAPFLESATYSVNGGPDMPLPLGPDNERLAGPGDFNIELDRASLSTLPDTNSVAITLTVLDGAFLTKEFTVRVNESAHASLPFEVDWDQLVDVGQANQIAAIVDGEWSLGDSGVEVAEQGYDRLIALGDETWRGNYEVLATFELLDWDPWGAVGLAVGWSGHEGNGNPRVDWPLEGLTWVRNVVPASEMQIMTFEKGLQTRTPFSLALETPYYLRAHTERDDGLATVSMRIWRADEKEPSDWKLTTQTAPRDGGVLLVNHHAAVRWGKVVVTPVH